MVSGSRKEPYGLADSNNKKQPPNRNVRQLLFYYRKRTDYLMMPSFLKILVRA